MISFEDYHIYQYNNASKGHLCFKCKTMISKTANFYTISKSMPSPMGTSQLFINFHIDCFKEMAGESWFFEETK